MTKKEAEIEASRLRQENPKPNRSVAWTIKTLENYATGKTTKASQGS